MSGLDNGYQLLNGHWVDVHGEDYADEWERDRQTKTQHHRGSVHAPPLSGSDAASKVQSVFASYRNPLRFTIEVRGDYIALAAQGKCNNVPQSEIELALGRSVTILETGGKVGILIRPPETQP